MFVDVVPVAVTMGGESTHQRPTMTRKHRIHLHLDLRFSYVEAGGWSRRVFAGVFTLFLTIDGILTAVAAGIDSATGAGR